MSVQIKLSFETTTRASPEFNDANAIVPNVLNAYWTSPNTQRGNNRMSRTKPRSPADTAPPAIVTSTVKRLDIRVKTTRTTSGANPLQPSSGRRRVETNPNSNTIAPTTTTAANSAKLFQLNFDMNFSETFAGTRVR